VETLVNRSVFDELESRGLRPLATPKVQDLKIEENQPLTFRAVYLHSGAVDPNRPVGWRNLSEKSGGGVVLDLGSHVLDMIYWLLGEYETVFADTTVLYPKRPDGAAPTFCDGDPLVTSSGKRASMASLRRRKAS